LFSSFFSDLILESLLIKDASKTSLQWEAEEATAAGEEAAEARRL
jgi:hypothetical protein